MRVISGTARGMKLKVPPGEAIRPTADRVKEALFNILGARVIGAAVVDLFAGSGALGIEALSRGAACCTFVENKRSHLAVIRHNLQQTGLINRARLLDREATAALQLLGREGGQADLIFLDPPYCSTLISGVLQAVHRLRLLREGGLVVVEFSRHNCNWVSLYPGMRLKKYGDTQLAFIDGSVLDAAAAEKEGQANGPDHV
ncbi:MAG TPA: 16S rRNA (guanine(966)-N(2))-methyltransferase RsmD [Bacillota bacterium]|nr:16S rRNA (guanine(966)-N(2))-methyltransferase RsmD [Bacillota bacterium]